MNERSNPTDTGMKRVWVPQLIVIGMLLWALYPGNPYKYYTFLRIVCCGVFAFLAAAAYEQRRYFWTVLLGIVAIIYNPILPVHLTRGVWSILNLLTIAPAIGSIFIIREEH